MGLRLRQPNSAHQVSDLARIRDEWYPGLLRVTSVMNLITAVDPDLPVRFSSALAHASSWKSVIVLLGVLVIGLIGRLLAEWQRRKTLVAVIKDARDGTVIVQNRGHGGPALRIEIGTGRNDSGDESTPGGGQ